MFLDRVIHLGETLGDQVKGRLPKKVKSFIGVPNVVQVKVHVLSLNKILIASSLRVLGPSYPFRRILERQGNVSFSDKTRIVY